MDPITMALTAALNGAKAYMSYRAGQKKQNLSEADMIRQQANADQVMDMSTATKQDAYGNKLIYTPGIGWHYDLTGESQGILSAEQGEMLKNLTEDAQRNRGYRERLDKISAGEVGDLNNVLNEYRYGPKPSEAESIDDITRLLLINRDKGMRETGNTIAKQALRMNQSNAIPRILRNVGEQNASGLEEAMLKGKLQGKQAYQSDVNFRNQDIFGRANNIMGLIRGVPQTNISKSGLYGDLDQNADQALQQSLAGAKSAMGIEDSAYKNFYSNQAAPFDWTKLVKPADITSLLGGLHGSTTTEPEPLK